MTLDTNVDRQHGYEVHAPHPCATEGRRSECEPYQDTTGAFRAIGLYEELSRRIRAQEADKE